MFKYLPGEFLYLFLLLFVLYIISFSGFKLDSLLRLLLVSLLFVLVVKLLEWSEL